MHTNFCTFIVPNVTLFCFFLHISINFNLLVATEVDTACGAILEELRRQDALDNTVIIFTTDNGNYHSEHGLADKW